MSEDKQIKQAGADEEKWLQLWHVNGMQVWMGVSDWMGKQKLTYGGVKAQSYETKTQWAELNQRISKYIEPLNKKSNVYHEYGLVVAKGK